MTVTDNSSGCTDTAVATLVVLQPEDCNTIDWGDLPTVYESAGAASHTIDTALRIGAVVDGEVGALPALLGAAPAGDDGAALADEDGLGFVPQITTASTSLTLLIPAVYNNTGGAALVTGWMDWNSDGDFADAGETSTTISISTGPTPGATLLTWSGFNNLGQILGGLTYLRLRLYPATNLSGPVSPSPNGSMSAGEVEDHAVTILGKTLAMRLRCLRPRPS